MAYKDNTTPLTTAQVSAQITAALASYSTTAAMTSAISDAVNGLTSEADVNALIETAKDKIALLSDVKAAGTSGGSAANTTNWIARALNTESDADGIVTLSSNQFTLQAGTYWIEWASPAIGTNGFRSRLWSVTASAEVKLGTSGYADRTASVANEWSEGVVKVVIASATTYQIEMIVGFNANGDEYGRATNKDSKDEIYTQVKITKTA